MLLKREILNLTCFRVLYFKILILEFRTINWLSACTSAMSKITTLQSAKIEIEKLGQRKEEHK